MAEVTTIPVTKTRKVVINAKHGGFGVSVTAARCMAELGHETAARAVREYDDMVAEWRRTGLNPRWADSPSASDLLREREPEWFGSLNDEAGERPDRSDMVLVRVVEELGAEASDKYADLRVVEIPADVEWHIEEYDGMEWVAENHRTWTAR